MSWIKEVPLSEGMEQANVIRVMSLDPRAAQAVLDLNAAITFGGSVLRRDQEEAVATMVSATNRCRY